MVEKYTTWCTFTLLLFLLSALSFLRYPVNAVIFALSRIEYADHDPRRIKMPTPDWREEKSQYVVESLCRVLAATEISETVRKELQHALFNALKILADAIEERVGGARRWSTGLVHLFYGSPELCEQWIMMMKDAEFNAETFLRFWEKEDQQKTTSKHSQH